MKWHISLCALFFALLATFCLAAEADRDDWEVLEEQAERLREKLGASMRHRQYQLHRVTNTDLLNVDEIVLGKN